MNKYKEALEKVNSCFRCCIQDDVVETIEELLEEKIEQEKSNWHREPQLDEPYYALYGDGCIEEYTYESGSCNKRRYNNFNCFPCSDFTKEQLEAAGVARMGLIERIAFTFAPDDWLTEEAKIKENRKGFSVYYNLNCKLWLANDGQWILQNKWYKHLETAKELCKWLNENCDYNGVMK